MPQRESSMTRTRTDDDELGEEKDWIPADAFKMAHSFRSRYGDELSTEIVNELLRELNNIYRERERRHTQRVKQQAHDEVNNMKRKLMYRPGYDQVVS